MSKRGMREGGSGGGGGGGGGERERKVREKIPYVTLVLKSPFAIELNTI